MLKDAYDGYLDVLDIMIEHRIIVAAACETEEFDRDYIEGDRTALHDLTCGLIEARKDGILCGAIWVFYHPFRQLLVNGRVEPVTYTFAQGIFASMPYFYLKLASPVLLPSISTVLIDELMQQSRQMGAQAIRVHPLPNMYSVLTRKYGFVDLLIDTMPYDVIHTLGQRKVIKLLPSVITEMSALLLAALQVPHGTADVDRLLAEGVDFKADGGLSLVAALQHHTHIVEEYISTADYKEYIQDTDCLNQLVTGLYQHVLRTRNTSVFLRMIQYDNRDKKSSAAYFRALRQAIVDNQCDLASGIFREIDFPVDLVADALQADSPVIFSEPGYFDTAQQNAWTVMIREIKQKNSTFGRAFAAYRVLNSCSQQELLANVIAADDPGVLWLIQDIPVETVMAYIVWKYSDDEGNTVDQLSQLTTAIGRLPDAVTRDSLYDFLKLHSTMTQDHVEDAKQRGWVNYQEDNRRQSVGRIREIISTAEQQGIDTQSDVTEMILKPLTRGSNAGQILTGTAMSVMGIVKERFRYLPDAR